MIRGLYNASAGMQVEQIRQDVIANNLANLNTSGFQREVAILEARTKLALRRTNDPVSADPLAAKRRVPIGELGTGVMVSRIFKRFEHGNMRESDNPFDLALDGEGFFTVADAKGDLLYTRSGEFTRDHNGMIVDKSGRALMGRNGPIFVPSGGTFNVTLDGTVSVNGRGVDQLAVVEFESPEEDLMKVGDTAVKLMGNGVTRPARAEVHQGMIEGPNVNPVQEMVEMIAALRHYEANQRSLQAQDETLGKAVNEVAKG